LVTRVPDMESSAGDGQIHHPVSSVGSPRRQPNAHAAPGVGSPGEGRHERQA
jgi:hypothetical protein